MNMNADEKLATKLGVEPRAIRKLDEDVVNRIAAGEIIQRPANALKELIENSLDAKASFIQITVKAGGMKLLQIQDNGTGIRHEDLSIVCERFTTSKLTTFEDLSSIATFGFRGEALASISHVAHLSIQTKTATNKCGYKASFEAGKLKAPAKPCASIQGTLITIEDLFYNMPQRKQALKSPAEEFQKISDVVSKYAVHNSSIGFLLKRHGENPSLRTAVGSTPEANIGMIYGSSIAKELVRVELSDEVHKFRMYAWATKVNFAAKKSTILLFINHRLVESTVLKVALDEAYNAYLPKGMHPFVYMSLELEPSSVDVNVHPTKHEVHFLYEEEIMSKIKCCIEAQLLGSNSTRIFYKQLKMPGVDDDAPLNEGNNSSQTQNIYAKDMIRTDAREQKLDKFLFSKEKATFCNVSAGNNSATETADAAANESFRTVAARKSREVRLTSVLTMQKALEKGCSVELRKTVKEFVFVGVVDTTFALCQYETKLYLCNTLKFSEELFYQRLVYEFQNFSKFSFKPALPLKDLLLLALDSSESGWTREDGNKEELAQRAMEILVEKSAIMREYFELCITADGQLESLPVLLHNHRPCSTFLPLFMLRLATEVEWDTEEECFRTFCQETARFYARFSEFALQDQQQRKQHKWLVEHVLYPGFKQYLLPPVKLKKQMYELTNLPTLYKVFERC